jgi:hypothetical protein
MKSIKGINKGIFEIKLIFLNILPNPMLLSTIEQTIYMTAVSLAGINPIIVSFKKTSSELLCRIKLMIRHP